MGSRLPWWSGVRFRRGQQGRCGRCRRQYPGKERGEGRRRWRHLDLGSCRAASKRRPMGPLPGARRGGGLGALDSPRRRSHPRLRRHRRLAGSADSAGSEVLRITGRTVGRIVSRASADGPGGAGSLG